MSRAFLRPVNDANEIPSAELATVTGGESPISEPMGKNIKIPRPEPLFGQPPDRGREQHAGDN